MIPKEEFKERQPVRRIAILGPRGTFTELTGQKMQELAYYNRTELVLVGSIREACEMVDQRIVPLAVIPIENSSDGQVIDTHRAFRDLENLQIRDELVLPVWHAAYTRPDGKKRIIASKDTAIRQCSRFKQKMQELYPDLEDLHTSSTAAAVQMAAEDPEIIAIGSLHAAQSLGIEDKLQKQEHVEDDPDNMTRFVVVTQKGELTPVGDNPKTTFIMILPERPGALFEQLDIMNNAGINMQKLKSFDEHGDSVSFLVTIEGRQDTLYLALGLRDLERHGATLRRMGSYPAFAYAIPKLTGEPEMQPILDRIRRRLQNGQEQGQNETILVFTLKDRVGALRDAIEPLYRRRKNLTRIDSIPTGRKLDEYGFFLGFENSDAADAELIEEVRRHCTQLEVIPHQ